jgi:hypothetical protein
MRQLREILRLKQEVGLTHRAIAEACGVASSTVSLYLERAAAAGVTVFVDFAGQKGHLVNGDTGEVIPVEIFVGVLGASGYLYAEGTLSQDLPSWVGAHVRMLEAFGGSPAIWVPDNLRSAVTKPHRYEPEINRTYQDLAQHYGAVVIPARIRRPQDKTLAEIGVLLAERWILAALRHRTFFTLEDLNTAITERVQAISARPMKRLGVSRQTRYEELDRPALRRLPTSRFELAEWTVGRVNIFCGVRRYGASGCLETTHTRGAALGCSA